jgi:hypothetical protein
MTKTRLRMAKVTNELVETLKQKQSEVVHL